MALMVIKFEEYYKTHERLFEVEIKELQNLITFITHHLKKEKLSPVFINDTQVAINESATNIILHAFPKKREKFYIRVKIFLASNKVRISLYHQGVGFTPDLIEHTC